MEAIIEELDQKLQTWEPGLAEEVRNRVTEIMRLADEDALDLGCSRAAEQDVLDLIDDDFPSR